MDSVLKDYDNLITSCISYVFFLIIISDDDD